jgi:hypothetical protein
MLIYLVYSLNDYKLFFLYKNDYKLLKNDLVNDFNRFATNIKYLYTNVQ